MGDMVSNGFNDYWLKFKESGSKEPEMDIYSTVEDMSGKINMALDQEYFDLRGCDLYNELCEYVSDVCHGGCCLFLRNALSERTP